MALQSVEAVFAAVILGLISIYVPKLLAAFTARTGVQISAAQVASVQGAAVTGAGILQTKIDQGILSIGHITVGDPAVVEEAAAAIARVPDAAAAINKSPTSMAETIIGLVDTTPRPALAVPVAAVG